MDKFKHPKEQQQQKQLVDCRRRKPSMEYNGRRGTVYKKMRPHTQHESPSTNNERSNSISVSTSTSSRGQGSNRGRSRSSTAGLDPLTSKAHKTPLPNLPPPPRSKVVNWRLACFMAREYLSRGTLLGKLCPLQDSTRTPRENTTANPKPVEAKEKQKEKEGLYCILTTDFLRSDDVYIPGIVNPSQLASWLGLNATFTDG